FVAGDLGWGDTPGDRLGRCAGRLASRVAGLAACLATCLDARLGVLLQCKAQAYQADDNDDDGDDDAEHLNVAPGLGPAHVQRRLMLLVAALLAGSVAGVRRHLVLLADSGRGQWTKTLALAHTGASGQSRREHAGAYG